MGRSDKEIIDYMVERYGDAYIFDELYDEFLEAVEELYEKLAEKKFAEFDKEEFPEFLNKLCTRLSGNTRRQGERCAVIRGCYREIKK